MRLRPSGVAGTLVALATPAIGTVLAVAITTSRLSPLMPIAFLVVGIATVVLLRSRGSDLIGWLVVGAAFLLPMNNVRLSSNLTVGDGFVILAVLLVVLARTSQRDLQIAGMDPLLVGIVMVVFGGLVGSFFAASVGASISGLAKFGFATTALPILFGLWRPGTAQLRAVGWSIVLGSTVSAMVGLVAIRVVGRAQGLASEPNHLALASLMAVGIGTGLLLSSPRGPARLVLLSAIAVLSAGVLSSGSRSGLVAEAVVLAIVALLTHHRSVVTALGAAVVAFGLLFLSGRLTKHGNSAISRLLGGGGAGVSDQARAQTLHAAFHTFALHPLTGQGFQSALATHDIVLEIAATAGIGGIVGLGLVAWLALRPVWARCHWGRVRPGRPGDALLIGTMASVAGFFANGLAGNQLYDRYIWIVITMAMALAHDLQRSDASFKAFEARAGW